MIFILLLSLNDEVASDKLSARLCAETVCYSCLWVSPAFYVLHDEDFSVVLQDDTSSPL